MGCPFAKSHTLVHLVLLQQTSKGWTIYKQEKLGGQDVEKHDPSTWYGTSCCVTYSTKASGHTCAEERKVGLNTIFSLLVFDF